MKNTLLILLLLMLHSCGPTTPSYTKPPISKAYYDYNKAENTKENDEIEINEELLESGICLGSEIDVSGYGVYGRRVEKIPNLASLMKGPISGNIILNFCINPEGDVTYSQVILDETTIEDKQLLKSALKISRKYKYEKKINAPEEQCGKFTFSLDVKK